MTIQRTTSGTPLDHEKAVADRYGAGARAIEASLCCTIEYDTRYLEALPEEIVAKDYGCGDPSRYVKAGETVVDLGSGAGKICYVLAQKVGAEGRVIGVDMNDEMLALARKYRGEVAAKIGYDNVTFAKGRIQDLALDLDALDRYLSSAPIRTADDLSRLENEMAKLRRDRPMVAPDSADVVVSNCVLNLVKPEDKTRLFAEIFNVLKRGGRAVISDIVADEDVPEHLANDPDLWSGCISGAFREDRFLDMFTNAGFYGVEILSRQEEPWQRVEGIEFRSVTVQAWKGKEGPCLERNQAVVYRGPWRRVVDDDGHTFPRGQRVAVCDKTYTIMTAENGPYGGDMIGIEPREEIPPKKAKPFEYAGLTLRHPRATKGEAYDAITEASGDCCGPDGC